MSRVALSVQSEKVSRRKEMNAETVAKIRDFLNRPDLVGTDAKLRDQIVNLDKDLAKARVELDQYTKLVNERQVKVLAVSQQIESLCKLALDVSAELPVYDRNADTSAPATEEVGEK